MATRRSSEEVQRLLENYRQSGMTRTAYCRQEGIPVTTLDYYVHRWAGKSKPRLARVLVAAEQPAIPTSFTLTLRSGRRIESGWKFVDADLARLIRIAEAL